MHERILGAIGARLSAEFPQVPVLADTAEQNVGRPAFFILSTGVEVTERITEAGFFATYGYDVVYDPGTDGAEGKCRETADALALALRRIPDLESQYAFRPIGLRFEMAEGELHALFRIRESLRERAEPKPKILEFGTGSEVF